ncbi:LexA family protein [Dolosicoccus paucivorans]|uniref:XRE family transcriptional regulator n=1 Tax=Dolosicoccus paucivorans TaxID=84521 RepID=A0A1G8JWZ9_9LACT|nr:XRE family transcriptional regulator [Dolosicoccus paucivorans]PMB85025.1 XRE family transcriptional regulator [Dolosicoccus paucivorans]PMC59020.1 XRE family transcriptional regulator [Dolosicoccus paucivorans]SDI35762.1 repressor LexA [Dolosicoccus paucivorans]
MEFKDIIKHLRKKNQMTQEDLAKALNISKTTVSSWERGANYPTMDRVILLADYFRVSMNTFFEQVPNSEDTLLLPVLGPILCSSSITAKENICEYRETLKASLPSGNLFYIKVKDDAMAPKIPKGGFVLVKEQSTVKNGDIAAVLLKDTKEVTLKRVRKLDDYILLETVNEEYAPYLINEHNPAQMIGKAVKLEVDL